MSGLDRRDYGTRLRRVLHALTDEATPRMTRFILRNRRRPADDARRHDPARAFQASPRQEIVNPVLARRIGGSTLPRVIFQTWKSRRVIPDNYRYWRETFIAHNPGHAVLLWDDDDNRSFIARHYPWFLDTYDAYPSEIFRADAVRYFFLFHHGGLYADMDTECLRPVGETLEHGDVILCRMGADDGFDHSLPNAIMASRPGQILWLYVIRLMMERAAAWRAASGPAGPEELTGPVLLKQAVDAFLRLGEREAWAAVEGILRRLGPEDARACANGTVVILDPAAWYPLDWSNPVHRLLRDQLQRNRQLLPAGEASALFPRSALVTYWSHSW